MSEKSVDEEVRIVVNLTMAFIFWIISQVGPRFVEGITIPGVNIEPYNSAEWIVWITAALIEIIFLIGAASDISIFIDILTRILVRRLGIKEKRPLKRIAGDSAYILLAILLAAILNPVVASIPQVGGYLTVIISLAALTIFLILIYDIGRTLYTALQEKTQNVADWIASLVGERRQEDKIEERRHDEQ